MKPFPNRTSTFQRIRLSHLTLTCCKGFISSETLFMGVP
jgi:hypothetical protein